MTPAAGGLRFVSAPATLRAAAGAETPGERRFTCTLYGGGVITDHAAYDAVAFDLLGLRAATPLPLLLQHDPGSNIGVIDRIINDGARLSGEGRLFTGIDAQAAAVAAKADAGMPWQMSVGIFPDRVEELPSGASATVNGRTVAGRTTIFRASRVREGSIVAIGADASTHARVFAGAPGARPAPAVGRAATMGEVYRRAALLTRYQREFKASIITAHEHCAAAGWRDW